MNLTDLAALTGAVTGPISLGLSIFNTYRNRPILRVSLCEGTYSSFIVPSTSIVSQKRILTNDLSEVIVTSLKIENIGNKAITINHLYVKNLLTDEWDMPFKQECSLVLIPIPNTKNKFLNLKLAPYIELPIRLKPYELKECQLVISKKNHLTSNSQFTLKLSQPHRNQQFTFSIPTLKAYLHSQKLQLKLDS